MKIKTIALGCPESFDDSKQLLSTLVARGCQEQKEFKGSDVVIINTCAFVESARQESLQLVQVVLEATTENTLVIVTGCLTKLNTALVKEHFAGYPNLEVLGSASAITDRLNLFKRIKGAKNLPLTLKQVPKSVYLNLSKGCCRNCAYCVVPHFKELFKSRHPAQLELEFKSLLPQGAFEFSLMGQNLADYGKDLGDPGLNLVELLKTLLLNDGAFWLRLMTIYPEGICDALLELIAGDPRVCPYLHVPLQHASNKMLAIMKVPFTRKDYISLVGKLRKKIPNLVLCTNFIVGHPGETPGDFEQLMQFIQDFPFEKANFFGFSPAPGVPALQLANPVNTDTVKARLEVARKIQSQMTASLNAKMIGKEVMVLVEEHHNLSQKYLKGRYYGQCPETDGSVFIQAYEKVEIGQLSRVKIVSVEGNHLIGVL